MECHVKNLSQSSSRSLFISLGSFSDWLDWLVLLSVSCDSVELLLATYIFLGFWCGRRTLSFHQSSIAESGLKSFRVGPSLSSNRSSSESLESRVRLFVFMTFICEKTRSNFPLEAGRENSSCTKTSTLDHSEAEGE